MGADSDWWLRWRVYARESKIIKTAKLQSVCKNFRIFLWDVLNPFKEGILGIGEILKQTLLFKNVL